METIIAALIIGICGIVVAVIALLPKINKIYDSLIQHEKDQEKGHGNLSGEHRQIRQEIVSKQKEVLESLNGVAQQVNTLYVEQTKANERHQSLCEKQLDSAAMIKKLLDLMSEVARVNYENKQLHQTIQQLEAKLAQQQPMQNLEPEPRRDDWEMEP